MPLCFQNSCEISVEIGVNHEPALILKPYEKRFIDCAENHFDITVSGDINSNIKNGKFHIALKSYYQFNSGQTSGTFCLTRKIKHFAYNACYDGILLSESGDNLMLLEVKDKENLVKQFRKSNRFKRLYMPIIEEPFEALLFFGIGVLLIYFFGWKTAILYYPLMYLFLFLISWFSQKVVTVFFKKTVKFDANKDFYEYLSPEYILQHYSSKDGEKTGNG